MDKLGTECKTRVVETRLLMTSDPQASTGHQANSKAAVESMKNEIIGLRKVLAKDSATHRQKLDAVQKNVAEVKDRQSRVSNVDGTLNAIQQQSISLESTVEARGWQMSGMMFFLLAVIVVIGFLMYN